MTDGQINDSILRVLTSGINMFDENYVEELANKINLDDFKANNPICKDLFKLINVLSDPDFDEDEDDAVDYYYHFIDNDKDNWSIFIRENFGNDWGKVAQFMVKFGY